MIRLLSLALLLCGSTLLTSAFSIITEQEEIPERGPVPRYRIVTGGDAFVFLPPTMWTLHKDDAQRQLVFRSEALQASFAVRFSTNGAPANAHALKMLMEERWPKAVLEEASECHARDRSGTVVEFSYAAAANTPFRTRLAVLDYGATKVELTLSAPEETFGKAHHAWTGILNSLGLAPQKSARAAIHSLQK